MASYTQHYQLHQWEPEDHFLRTDFNTDLQKIDTELGSLAEGLGSKLEAEMASYLGDGEDTLQVELGYAPLAVLISNDGQLTGGLLGLRGGQERNITLTSTGFTLQKNNTSIPNIGGVTYHCLVFRESGT